jgi:hypothetical protein
MSKRTQIIENNLNVKLPTDYKNFIDDVGIISNENGEVFGYTEGIDIDKIPCVIGATKLYKEDYKIISDKEIVIGFDDFFNSPIILDTEDGSIFNVDFNKKTQISSNFIEWLNKKMES